MSSRRGKLYVVSAPSGAGKTSLLAALMEQQPNLAVSTSYTTRGPRPGEADGCDYHFVDTSTFSDMQSADRFLESAEVFGNDYGTAAEDVERLRQAGRDVVLEIDWQGARKVRRRVPEVVTIFILPPSREALRARLTGRGTDSEDAIGRRMKAAATEMRHWSEYDYVVVNESFDHALAELEAIFAGRGDRARRDRPGLAKLAARLVASA